MLRAMLRINGDDASRKAGNTYSQQNRGRIQARLGAMRADGIVPMDPKDEETMRKKEANPYTTMSQRAVRVPRVGMGRAPERPPLVDCLPRRRPEEDIRAKEDDFARPRAPAGKPVASSDAKRADLALRNQFYGQTPQEILSAAPAPRRGAGAAPEAPGVSAEQHLHNQIVDEISERQDFLDEMARLGQGQRHQQQIELEIAERMRDLKKLQPYLAEQGSQDAPAA